jgi:hypothetical protein
MHSLINELSDHDTQLLNLENVIAPIKEFTPSLGTLIASLEMNFNLS